MARLLARSGPFAPAEFAIADEASIGRDPSNSIVLADERISSRHARLRKDAGTGQYWIEDLGSRNGSFVDGLPVAEPERLDSLAVLRFGPEGDFLFQAAFTRAVPEPAAGSLTGAAFDLPVLPAALAGAPSAPRGAPRTLGAIEDVPLPAALASPPPTPPRAPTVLEPVAPELPPGLFATAAVSPGRARRLVLRLEVETGDWRSFDLPEGETVVGRDPACSISLAHATLSRRHVRIERAGERLVVTDLGSTNGSYLGDQRLPAERPTEWPAEGRAAFGSLAAELAWEDDE